MKKLSNKILIPAVCVTGALLFAAMHLYGGFSGDAQTARVYKDGRLVQTVDLTSLDEPCRIDLGSNVVCAERNGVCMEHADCPDGLCIKQGKITKGGRSIVCLPNKVIVEIIGKGGGADAVAGAR